MSRKSRRHGPRVNKGTKGPRRHPKDGIKTNVGDPQVRGITAKPPRPGK